MNNDNRLFCKLNIPSYYNFLTTEETIERINNFKHIIDLGLVGDLPNQDALAKLIKETISKHIDDYFYFSHDRHLHWITINFCKAEHLILFRISNYFGINPGNIQLREMKF